MRSRQIRAAAVELLVDNEFSSSDADVRLRIYELLANLSKVTGKSEQYFVARDLAASERDARADYDDMIADQHDALRAEQDASSQLPGEDGRQVG